MSKLNYDNSAKRTKPSMLKAGTFTTGNYIFLKLYALVEHPN